MLDKVIELFAHGKTFTKQEEKEDLEEYLFSTLMLDKDKFKLCQEEGQVKRSKKGTLLSMKDKSVCRYCAQFFCEPFARRKHEKEMHENRQKYTCNICSESFLTSNGLTAHKKNKHVDSNKIFICKQCGNKYQSESALKRHCQTEQHPYTDSTVPLKIGYKKCEICGQQVVPRFYQKHKDKKHGENSIKHKCNFCDYEAKRTDHLYSHMKHKHNSHNMKCSAIKEHFTRNKSFTCSDCMRTFSTADSAIHHLRLSNCEEVLCDICEKKFSSKSNLNKHMKKFHK